MQTALTGRTHGCTDQCCTREENPCQLGAVHTWHIAEVSRLRVIRPLCDMKRTSVSGAWMSQNDPTRTFIVGGDQKRTVVLLGQLMRGAIWQTGTQLPTCRWQSQV